MARYSMVCTRSVETYETTVFEVEAETQEKAVALAEEEASDAYWTAITRKVSIGAVIPTLMKG